MGKGLFKQILTDKEILNSLTLIGRLGLNMVISLLVCFLPALYLERRFNTGFIIMAIGILLGIFSGVYLNYRYLKRYYEKDANKH